MKPCLRGRNPTAYTVPLSKTGLQRRYKAILKERLSAVEAMLA